MPDSLRILFLTPRLPYPPEQGAALRNFNLLRYLGRRHAVTLIGFDSNSADVAGPLRDLCREVLAIPSPRRSPALRLAQTFDPRPDLALRLRSARFAAAVAGLRRYRFDLVQCEALELFPYTRSLSLPLVLDAHNAEWRLQERAYQAARGRRDLAGTLYSAVQYRKLRRYEGAAVRSARWTIAVSAADRDDLLGVAGQARLSVIPNGVDAAAYAPLEHIAEEPDTILFAGKMDFRPNVEGALWLASDIMPRVWAQRPRARLIVFGMQPAPAVQQLAGDQRVTVTGYVPGVDGERRALARATVIAVPLLSGGGTRLKVLNALAAGRAVVSTPLGAAGFALDDGRDLLLASDAAAFARAIVGLLDDQALRHRLGCAGRQTVLDRYTWEKLLPELDSIYEEVLNN